MTSNKTKHFADWIILIELLIYATMSIIAKQLYFKYNQLYL